MEKELLIARLIGIELLFESKLEAVREKKGIAAGCSEDTLEYLEQRYIRDCETLETAIKYIREV